MFHHDNFLYKFLIRQSRQELVERPFRLVIVKFKAEEAKEYWLLTNDFNLSAKEIAQNYRRRWDIEVFFRFFKQEINVSHLVSLNKNGSLH